MVKRQPKSITRQDHGLKSLALVALITLSLQICLAALISSPLQAETQYVPVFDLSHPCLQAALNIGGERQVIPPLLL